MMNPIGMNQIGINFMMMNNNAMNMDNTTLNIKNIVKPYENKIKELEEIIRQKDFEITVLKQKLNNNNMNMNNFPINSFNQMNPMINNMNNNQINITIPNTKDKGKEINIKVQKDEEIFNIKIFENDLPSELRKKLGRGSYNYKYKPLISHLSLKDNNIKDNAIIQFTKSMMNLVFMNENGSADSLVLSYDCPLGIALCYYILKFHHPLDLMSIINNENKMNFLFNDIHLKIKDKTPIKTVFNNTPWPQVNVIKK